MVFNIKRLLGKVPGGKSTIASYAAALYLIKEHTGMSEEKIEEVLSKALEGELETNIAESQWYMDGDTLNTGVYCLTKDILFRELAMFKILGNTKKIEKVKKICKKFNPVILDKTKKSVVIQVTALRAEIDKLALDLKSLGLISTSRTGAVAMTKGSKIFS